MTITAEQVRERVGLRPLAEVEYDAYINLERRTKGLGRADAIENRHRRTGRTTDMLVQACVIASDGQEVMIVVHDQASVNRLKTQILSWCNELMLPDHLIRFTTMNTPNVRNDRHDVIFRDHLVMGII